MTTLILVLSTNGCGTVDEKSPLTDDAPVRPANDVVMAVERASEHFNLALDLPGAVIEAAVPVSKGPCTADYESDLYSVRHTWSAAGVPEEELHRAMDRLHAELPAQGWRVLLYEPDSSESESLELRVEHDEDFLLAHARFLDGRKVGVPDGRESEITLTVFTPCYEDPDAASY
ncbi:hypothetical protein [Streptomyces otsuchiensis]|uniref:hypothetical protein n=1 Tax=Streptomyces otsuchiensis TaxID=2681388 RepID=UPI00102F905E|nr:hypothetical protein [Streptomyces otsuchiensis]